MSAARPTVVVARSSATTTKPSDNSLGKPRFGGAFCFRVRCVKRFGSLFVLAVFGLSACGGGSSTSNSQPPPSTPQTTRTIGGVKDTSLAGCLSGKDFSMGPTTKTVNGTSPAGVVFSLKLFGDKAAAQAAYEKADPKTSALVENGVLDYSGNVRPSSNAPLPKLSSKDVSTIAACIRSSK